MTEEAAGAPAFLMIGGAPNPVAPFSHLVEAQGWVFVTGQMPTWPDDDARPLPAGIEAQTHRVMANLRIVLGGVGLDFPNVIVARVYLTHFEEDYARMNEIYAGYFAANRRPARTCIGVTGLARGARVEVDFLARR